MSIETAEAFKQACKDYGFGPTQILPHGSYLINLASAKPELLEKSYNAFVDELKRCEMLGIRYAMMLLLLSLLCSAIVSQTFFECLVYVLHLKCTTTLIV